MKIYLVIFFVLWLTTHCLGQAPNSKIDRKDLKRFVTLLTSDALEGRGTGTEGQRKAERFIAKRFAELGLSKYNKEGYLEKFHLTETYWGGVYIKTQKRTLENFKNMVFQGGNAQNEEVEREVVFGGRGTEAELAQIEVKDRLVLVLVDNLRAYYDVNIRLGKRKASGVILANPDKENQFETIRKTFENHALGKRLSLPVSKGRKGDLAEWDTINLINTIIIPKAELKTVTGLSAKALTRLMTEHRVKDFAPKSVRVKFEKIQKEIETANVVGVIKGRSPRSILVSAHYDHLGKSAEEYFPGADDNASGTAALLEIAEEFSTSGDLEYGIIFLATSAEEAGLLGSYYHVHRPEFEAENILCNLNLDMISRSDGIHNNENYLYCIGADHSTEIEVVIRKADSEFSKCSFDYSIDNANDPGGLFSRSDSCNFHKKGIPAFLFFSGLHNDYHKPTDTADKIDFRSLENRVRQISLIIELLQGWESKD